MARRPRRAPRDNVITTITVKKKKKGWKKNKMNTSPRQPSVHRAVVVVVVVGVSASAPRVSSSSPGLRLVTHVPITHSRRRRRHHRSSLSFAYHGEPPPPENGVRKDRARQKTISFRARVVVDRVTSRARTDFTPYVVTHDS